MKSKIENLKREMSPRGERGPKTALAGLGRERCGRGGVFRGRCEVCRQRKMIGFVTMRGDLLGGAAIAAGVLCRECADVYRQCGGILKGPEKIVGEKAVGELAS